MGTYHAFYKLAEEPFALTPDPRFLFESKQHHEALQEVLAGLETQKGIIALIGEIGTGKTTLCRALLQVLPAQYRTALLLNPHVAEEDLVRAILEDLGVQTAGLEMSSMIGALETFLLRIGERGECAVVMLDEVQHLSPAVLEHLRLLSNFETPTHKLLQIILVGQSELEEKLERHDLRQLQQRIGVRFYLRPLSRRDTMSYIEHRLRRAGCTGRLPFTRAALWRIRRFSQGTPRLINLVCDRALFVGYLERAPRIGGALVATAIKRLAQRRRRSWLPKLATATTGGVAVAVLAGIAAWQVAAMTEFQSLLPASLSAGWQARATKREPPPAPTPVVPQLPAPVSTAAAQLPESPPVQAPAETLPRTPTSPAEGLQYQLARLLALWGAGEQRPEDIARWPVTPDGFPHVRRIAARRGLEAMFFETLPWSAIAAIGLPVLVKIGGEEAFALLLRREGDRAVLLSAQGLEYERPIRALAAQQLRSAWFLWRNTDEWALLAPWEWSPRLLTLVAARLSGAGYLSAPFPATYDTRFSDAVRRFQQGVGLTADGIIGPRTVLALVRVTEPAAVPSLQGVGAP